MRLAILTVVTLVCAAGVFVYSTDNLSTLGASASGDRLARIEQSPNFRDGTFQNPIPTEVMVPSKGFKVAKEWIFSREQRTPPQPLPSAPVSRASFDAPPEDDVRLCWLGHSTVLLELEGRRILFDPVWASRSSPTQLAGPKRFQPVPLPREELPELDAVVISHDHYDHLDKSTIQFLAASDPALPFLVPLGVGAHLEKWGVAASRIRELDWWDETEVAGVHFIEAPARHFSGRGLLDRNKTLWASWIVIGRAHRAYFGGDSGYWPGFALIGEEFGPFDVTMLEIGAWHPNWGLIHLGPGNALQAQRDLRGRLLLPIHWGTFNLALHAWDEPIRTLIAAAPAVGVQVLTPMLGEVVRASDPRPASDWFAPRSP